MHLSKFYLAIAIITIATICYNAVSKINLQKLSKYLGVKTINIFSFLPLENFQKTLHYKGMGKSATFLSKALAWRTGTSLQQAHEFQSNTENTNMVH